MLDFVEKNTPSVNLWEWLDNEAAQKAWTNEYENNARFPGVLAPEHRVWWWRSVGHWFWAVRLSLYEKIEQHWRLDRDPKKAPFWIYRLLEPIYFDDFNPWYSVEWNHCPYCGFKSEIRDGWIECFDSDWYHFTGGGSYFNGDHTVHYFEGEWTCPRCLRNWEYGDSD